MDGFSMDFDRFPHRSAPCVLQARHIANVRFLLSCSGLLSFSLFCSLLFCAASTDALYRKCMVCFWSSLVWSVLVSVLLCTRCGCWLQLCCFGGLSAVPPLSGDLVDFFCFFPLVFLFPLFFAFFVLVFFFSSSSLLLLLWLSRV
jgi:hypothetical protein